MDIVYNAACDVFYDINRLEVGLSSFNYITDLHPATQIEIRRNTPLPPPAHTAEGKQDFFFSTVHEKQTSDQTHKQHIFMYLLTRSAETSVLSVLSKLPGCPAARRLFGLPGEEGGWSVGYAPTCVCWVNQCRR